MDLLIKNVHPRPIRRKLLEIYKQAYRGWEEYAYRTSRESLEYLKWLQKRAPEGFLMAFLEERPIGFVAVDGWGIWVRMIKESAVKPSAV